jgi:HNH endonuclease
MPSRTTLPPGLCVCRDPKCTILYGECHCGCKGIAPISKASNQALGYIKGMPRAFIPHHQVSLYADPLEVRFWRSVDKNGPIVREELGRCWLWNLSMDVYGYGKIAGSATLAEKRKLLKAHRVSWQIANGPIPEGFGVLHRCDNPPCCNPDHLFLGDNDANMKDAAQKQRLPRGKQHHNGHFTSEQVLEIRSVYIGGGVSQSELGKRFGVSRSAILGILRKDTYAYVQG